MQDYDHHDLDKLTRYFLITLGVICFIGIIMVYSASYIYAKDVYKNSAYFLIRQLMFTGIGVGVAYFLSRTRFSFWFRMGQYLHIVFIVLLILTFIPGIGTSTKGASRWINLGFMRLQPAEFIKYSTIFVSLYFFENFQNFDRKELIKNCVAILLPLGLLLKQPDFGTFSICFMLIAFVCYMSSFPRKLFYSIIGVGGVLAVAALFLQSYRVQRLLTFLDPWKNPKTSGFQIIQSYLAFANGAFFGQGIGNSNEKLFYLPEAHNDFIFSVLGEELGFVGVLFVVALVGIFIFLGFRIALAIRSRISGIIVSAIIFALGLQWTLNMCVVLGLLPTKGLNLPFISYGGSSLVANFIGIGFILSAIREHKRNSDLGLDENFTYQSKS